MVPCLIFLLQTLDDTSEIVLANETDGVITYLTNHKFADMCKDRQCDSSTDQAMQLALAHKQGAELGTDYRPWDVLAAHVYQPDLQMGLVFKDNYEAVRQPMRDASGISAGISVAVMIAMLILSIVIFLVICNCLRTLWFQSPVPPPLVVQSSRSNLQLALFCIYAIFGIMCIVITLSLQNGVFYDHTKVNMHVGAELAATALDLSQTVVGNDALDSILTFLSSFNTHDLIGPMEIQVARQVCLAAPT